MALSTTLYTLSKLYDVPVGFVAPLPSFEAVYCFICGRLRLAVDIGWFVLFLLRVLDSRFILSVRDKRWQKERRDFCRYPRTSSRAEIMWYVPFTNPWLTPTRFSRCKMSPRSDANSRWQTSEIILTMSITRFDMKLQYEGDLVSKGNDVLKTFLFSVRCNAKKHCLNPNSGQNLHG